MKDDGDTLLQRRSSMTIIMLCGNNGKFKHTHLNQSLMVKLGHADHWVDAASSLVDVQHDGGRAFHGTVGGELEQVW